MRIGLAAEPGLNGSFGIEEMSSIFSAGAYPIRRTGSRQTRRKPVRQRLHPGFLPPIQNSPGHTFLAGTWLQMRAPPFIRSLSGQTIQSPTIITTSTNSLALLTSMDLLSVLRHTARACLGYTTGIR